MTEKISTNEMIGIIEAGYWPTIKGRPMRDAIIARLKELDRLEAHWQKLREAVDKAISIIEVDERYHYAPANVEVNAPLALIQVDLEGRIRTLKAIKKKLDELEGE